MSISIEQQLVAALQEAQRELALLNRNRDTAQADPERALIAIRAALKAAGVE